MSLHSSSHRHFATTSWSMVLAAGDQNPEQASTALEELCQNYWPPLYAYLRRCGHDRAEASDLVQAFFFDFLEQNKIELADRNRGKFRSYLLTSLKNFVSNEARKSRALKRGGDRKIVSMDAATVESCHDFTAQSDATPESFFDRHWAMAIIEKAMLALQQEYEEDNKLEIFEQLKAHLHGSPDAIPYAQLAEQLGMTVVAIKVSVHRLKKRCQNHIRRQIAHTVENETEIDDEIDQLFQSL